MLTTLELYHYYLGLVLSDLYELLDRGFKGSYPYMVSTLHIINLTYGIIHCSPAATGMLERGKLKDALTWFAEETKILPVEVTEGFLKTVLDGFPHQLEVSTYSLSAQHMSKCRIDKDTHYYCVNVLCILRDVLLVLKHKRSVLWSVNDDSVDNREMVNRIANTIDMKLNKATT